MAAAGLEKRILILHDLAEREQSLPCLYPRSSMGFFVALASRDLFLLFCFLGQLLLPSLGAYPLLPGWQQCVACVGNLAVREYNKDQQM